MIDRSRRVAIGFAVTAMVLAGAASAFAQPLRTQKVIEVYPGPNALAKALAKANPGDTLRIHTGTFDEADTVATASLTIVAAGDGPVTLDGGCAAADTLTIQAQDTTLDGGTLGDLTIQGATDKELFLANASDSVVRALTIRNTCSSPFAGINVVGGHGIRIVGNLTLGDFDGLYVSGAGTGSPIVVAGNDVGSGEEGIEVSYVSGVVVKVIWNTVHGTGLSGIRLVGTDGVIVRHNTVTGAEDVGIGLLDDVRNALIVRNVVLGNGTDLDNGGGKSNCFRRNEHHSQDGWIGCRP